MLRGERREGLTYQWPSRCSGCDRQCERSAARGLQLCSYGVNSLRLDADVLIAGIVVRDAPGLSAARKKMLRSAHNGPTVADVQHVVERYREIAAADLRELQERRDRVIAEYRDTAAYKADLLELLKPDLRKMLAQIHDYKQFVSQIVQNINVVLERRAPGAEIDRKLAAAAHEEAAIYWAARLMEEKIQTALFLLDPEKISDPESIKVFRLHGCVLKYVRIYQSAFALKSVRVSVAGESYANVRANPAAASVIPHTLIDNALKYAPRGSHVEIEFSESESDVELSVSSYGPAIHTDERESIFDLFVRGREAKRIEPDGTGFGLYLSQLIAEALGTRIEVKQDRKAAQGDLQWTTFSICFSRA